MAACQWMAVGAGAVFDEAVGEVVAVQERGVADEQCTTVDGANLADGGRFPGSVLAAPGSPGLPASWSQRQKSRASARVAWLQGTLMAPVNLLCTLSS